MAINSIGAMSVQPLVRSFVAIALAPSFHDNLASGRDRNHSIERLVRVVTPGFDDVDARSRIPASNGAGTNSSNCPTGCSVWGTAQRNQSAEYVDHAPGTDAANDADGQVLAGVLVNDRRAHVYFLWIVSSERKSLGHYRSKSSAKSLITTRANN